MQSIQRAGDDADAQLMFVVPFVVLLPTFYLGLSLDW